MTLTSRPGWYRVPLRVRGRQLAPGCEADGRYLGTVRAQDLMDALAADEGTDIVALTAGTTPVHDDDTVGAALRQLDRGADAVPVASADGRLVGWVRHLQRSNRGT